MPRKIQISVPVFFIQEGEYITAFCPHLQISGYGKNLDDAMVSFDQCMEMFLEEAMERDTLEDMLTKLGWTPVQNVFSPPEVPFQFLPQHSITQRQKVFSIPVPG
jgi:hypothetical protein